MLSLLSSLTHSRPVAPPTNVLNYPLAPPCALQTVEKLEKQKDTIKGRLEEFADTATEGEAKGAEAEAPVLRRPRRKGDISTDFDI
eukprot:1192632-Prorocentrum_minimum.AAC.2